MPGSPYSHGRYLLGDGSYGSRRKGAMYGDPGLGALIAGGLPLLKGVAQKAVGLFKKAPAIAAPTIAPTVVRPTVQTIKRVAGPVATIAAGTAAGELALSVVGHSNYRRPYRRMNPLNPKALKRATRRLAGFHTFATSTERELRKLAPVKRSCAPRKKSCR